MFFYFYNINVLNYSNNIPVTFNFYNYRKDKYMHVSLSELFNYLNNSIFRID